MKQRLLNLLFLTAMIFGGLQLVSAQDKTALVNKLVGLTANFHPSVMESKMAENNIDSNKYEAEEGRDYAEFLTSAIKSNTQLNAEQKAFANKNLERLVDLMAFEIWTIQERTMNRGKQLRESLRQNYSAKLTDAELNNLIDYFSKDEGRKTLRYIAISPQRQKSGKPDYEPEEFLAYGNFIKTPLGNKFFKIFTTDTEAEMTTKFTAGNKQMRAEMNKFYEDGSLNQIVNQFIADNSEPGKTNKSNAANQLADSFMALKKETENGSALKISDEQSELDKAQKESYAELFDETLKENNSLTADQKAFVKANNNKLSEIFAAKQKVFADEFKQNSDLAMKKVVTALFNIYLSSDEMKSINTAFKTPAGKDLIKYLLYETESGNPELDKFVETKAGSRILTILKRKMVKPMNAATKPIYDKYMEATFKLLEPAELNKIINEFVAANYKK